MCSQERWLTAVHEAPEGTVGGYNPPGYSDVSRIDDVGIDHWQDVSDSELTTQGHVRWRFEGFHTENCGERLHCLFAPVVYQKPILVLLFDMTCRDSLTGVRTDMQWQRDFIQGLSEEELDDMDGASDGVVNFDSRGVVMVGVKLDEYLEAEADVTWKLTYAEMHEVRLPSIV